MSGDTEQKFIVPDEDDEEPQTSGKKPHAVRFPKFISVTTRIFTVDARYKIFKYMYKIFDYDELGTIMDAYASVHKSLVEQGIESETVAVEDFEIVSSGKDLRVENFDDLNHYSG